MQVETPARNVDKLGRVPHSHEPFRLGQAGCPAGSAERSDRFARGVGRHDDVDVVHRPHVRVRVAVEDHRRALDEERVDAFRLQRAGRTDSRVEQRLRAPLRN